MFTSPRLLSALPLLAALTAASPIALAPRTDYTTSFVTEIATYTCSGGYAIPGNISTTTGCINLTASSYLIGELPGVDCTFTVYTGHDCPAGAVLATTDIPAGSGTVCAFGGVYDGGECSYCVKRSATYTCAA
ncbi:hypothetical protein MMC30_002075 [Trapelia coarctata]|nr:hypothetical protein [Trapelia coarctata]